jgi:hypothetical protein
MYNYIGLYQYQMDQVAWLSSGWETDFLPCEPGN